MKNIVLFATDDFGGAGKAALRIVRALNKSGRYCKMLVKTKTLMDNDIIQINAINSFSINKRIKNFINAKKTINIKLDNKYYFGYKYDDILYTDIVRYIDYIPDTIIVTWITWFLSPQTIKELALYYNAKIIICPLDMSLFTGGCHYAWECKGYENECKDCPAILSDEHKNVAVNRLRDKILNWEHKNVEFWSFSSGLYLELNNSALARNKKITRLFLPIDENVFNNNSREIAKKVFNIPIDNKIILFGSNFSFEIRKGISFFLESIRLLYHILSAEVREKIKIIVVGKKDNNENNYDVPFDVLNLDYIKDELLLSQLYQASDVLVCSSIQDAGPMMINEAQICGLPVLAFNIGVSSDFIINGFSGYLCNIGDIQQIAHGIKDVILNESNFDNSKIAAAAFNKTSFTSFAKALNSQESLSTT